MTRYHAGFHTMAMDLSLSICDSPPLSLRHGITLINSYPYCHFQEVHTYTRRNACLLMTNSRY